MRAKKGFYAVAAPNIHVCRVTDPITCGAAQKILREESLYVYPATYFSVQEQTIYITKWCCSRHPEHHANVLYGWPQAALVHTCLSINKRQKILRDEGLYVCAVICLSRMNKSFVSPLSCCRRLRRTSRQCSRRAQSYVAVNQRSGARTCHRGESRYVKLCFECAVTPDSSLCLQVRNLSLIQHLRNIDFWILRSTSATSSGRIVQSCESSLASMAFPIAILYHPCLFSDYGAIKSSFLPCICVY